MAAIRKLKFESEWQKELQRFNKEKMKEPLFINTAMTPNDAELLLETNGGNRGLLLQMVEQFHNAMELGDWGLNGETIKIAPNGDLMDGQHRLSALIEHGSPIRMSLALGVNPILFDVTDTGRSRTAGDILRIAGYKNVNNNAAAMAILLRYQHSESFSSRPRLIPRQILLAMKRWPHMQDYVAATHPINHIVSSSATQFMMYVLDTVDPEAALDFFAKIQTGEGLARTSPILLFRDLHLKLKLKTLRLDRVHVMASYILTWNAYYTKQHPKSIKWNGKGFPVISGVERSQLFKKGSGYGTYKT